MPNITTTIRAKSKPFDCRIENEELIDYFIIWMISKVLGENSACLGSLYL